MPREARCGHSRRSSGSHCRSFSGRERCAVCRGAIVLGAGLVAAGFWLKASLEERFLSVELGDDYAAYRGRTPMLIPLLRV